MSGFASSAAQNLSGVPRADRATTREIERKQRKTASERDSSSTRAQDEVMVAPEHVERVEHLRSLKDNAQEESHEDRLGSYSAQGARPGEQGAKVDLNG
ncbi:MAG: hypothetical protein IT439_06680 [Phycisphaerales bacterium]|nr:hypothetical protein [Phycisphaerales bacterium]